MRVRLARPRETIRLTKPELTYPNELLNDYLERALSVRPDKSVTWPFDETSGTTARAITGLQANILPNPGFELRSGDDFTTWVETVGATGTIEAKTDPGDFHGGATGVKITKGGVGTHKLELLLLTVVPSTTYTFSFWTKGDGINKAGDYGIEAINGTPGWLVNAQTNVIAADWTRISATVITPAGCTLVGIRLGCGVLAGMPDGAFVYYDDVELLAPTGLGTPFAATYSGVTLAQPGGPDGRLVPSFDGLNDYVTQGKNATINAFSGANGGIAIPILPTAASWTDGSADYYWYWAVDVNNYIAIYKSTTNNQLVWEYKAGGTLKQVTSTAYGGRTTPIILGLTWDKGNDAMRAFADGVQVGETQTDLGTWAGYLAATTTCIGSVSSSSPATVANGKIGPPAAWMGVTATVGEMGYVGRG